MTTLTKLLGLVILTLAAIGAPYDAFAANPEPPPLLTRIKVATVAAPDVSALGHWYERWLDFRVRERGTISSAVAESWGAPRMAGRRYVLMSTDSHPDVYIRGVEIDSVRDYKPSTTYGWNAFELVVDDVNALHQRLRAGGVRILGAPKPLASVPTIHVMQAEGPGQEVLYFAMQTGDRSKSTLPDPKGTIGRLFILILGGRNVEEVRDFYAETFRMRKNSIRESRSEVIRSAWGIPDGTHPITLLRLHEHGNSIQLDGYTAPHLTARPRVEGQLPPGNSMASFQVADLDELKLPFIRAPAVLDGAAYGGRRAATFVGPAGELTELIELEPRVAAH